MYTFSAEYYKTYIHLHITRYVPKYRGKEKIYTTSFEHVYVYVNHSTLVNVPVDDKYSKRNMYRNYCIYNMPSLIPVQNVQF